MKTRKVLVDALKLLVIGMAAIALSGVGGAQAAALPNQIALRDQNLDTGVIVVDSVTAAQNGWVVIYNNPELASSEIAGYAPVHQGLNVGVRVTVQKPKTTNWPTLWAVLHVDNSPLGVFEWGQNNRAYNDPPVMQNGGYVSVAFSTLVGDYESTATLRTSGGTAPAIPKTAQITVHTQDLNTRVITVDSVTATQDGWVVIYDNPNFTSGAIVGYAPVYQGTNTGVKVAIDISKVTGLPILWAVLHVDNGVKGLFEYGLNGLPYNDAPVMQNGWYVSAGFGTNVP